MKTLAGAAALAVVLVLLAAYSGVFARYGADPAWAVRVAWIGVIPGLLALLVLTALNLSPLARLILSAGCLVLAHAVARAGAHRLVASLGEDMLAARMWYHGWIGTTAAAILLLAVLITLPSSLKRLE